jgi:hypothetical protein
MEVTGVDRDAHDEHRDENTKTTGGREAKTHANGEHIFHSHPKNTRHIRFVAKKNSISSTEREGFNLAFFRP